MRLRGGPQDDCLTIRARGVLDLGTAGRLEHEVLSGLNAGFSRVVVDLAGVSMWDAAGMSGLVRAGRACAVLGGSLRLAAPRPLAVQALTFVRFGVTVPVYATVAAAIAGDERWRIKD